MLQRRDFQTVVASYNDVLVCENSGFQHVVYCCNRVFQYDPETEDGSIYTAANGDRIFVNHEDGRRFITRFENASGDVVATLITGSEGKPIYRCNGQSLGVIAMAHVIVEADGYSIY